LPRVINGRAVTVALGQKGKGKTMQFNTDKMCANEIRKGALLITKASDIDMDMGCYGEVAVNPHSGNVYLWLEEYPFSLFIGLGGSDRIMACWNSGYTDKEEIIDAHDATLHDLETWAENLNQIDEEENA
jgi:hypothetical protein